MDLGCGLGRHSIYMAKKGLSVTAADLSDFGLNHLKEWAAQEQLSVKTAVCDMEALPFEDNSFDCVLCYNVIYHAGRAGVIKTLAELKRVLKPDGELFLTMLSKKSDGFLHARSDQRIDENTIIRDDCEETERGVPHFYLEYKELAEFLKGGKRKAFHRNVVSIPKENMKKPAGTGNFCLKT